MMKNVIQMENPKQTSTGKKVSRAMKKWWKDRKAKQKKVVESKEKPKSAALHRGSYMRGYRAARRPQKAFKYIEAPRQQAYYDVIGGDELAYLMGQTDPEGEPIFHPDMQKVKNETNGKEIWLVSVKLITPEYIAKHLRLDKVE